MIGNQTGFDDPAVIATFAVAAVTLVLAWATARMAHSTRDAAVATKTSAQATQRSADATEKAADAAQASAAAAADSVTAAQATASATTGQLQLARDEWESAIQPMLAEAVFDPAARMRGYAYPMTGHTQDLSPESLANFERDGYRYLSVAFRNVGNGVAVVTSAGTSPPCPGGVAFDRTVVPPNEVVRLLVTIPTDAADAEPVLQAIGSGSVSLSIGYTSATGNHRYVTRADLRFDPTRVRQISILRAGDEQPFVQSGPRDA